VDVAADGEEGLAMGLEGIHDVIILDIRLPKLDGLQVLKALRREKVMTPVLLQVADLVLDPARRTVARGGGEKIELTPREFALLDYFMRHPGRVLTRTMIAEHVWDYDFDTSTNVIDVYVNYLRRKIDAGREPKLLHTVRGVGYVLKAE
jgi:two-component system copper resistance phosphate regulon response regulator CusR